MTSVLGNKKDAHPWNHWMSIELVWHKWYRDACALKNDRNVCKYHLEIMTTLTHRFIVCKQERIKKIIHLESLVNVIEQSLCCSKFSENTNLH